MQQNSTILIVDDDAAMRRMLQALLAMPGYQLTFACDGAEALLQAAALLPDLILLDVMMPKIDGFEVCRRLRAHPLLAEVPIVMVTALDDQDSRLQGLEAGADDFICKPFERVELRARVRSILRLNRFRRLHDERKKFERMVELSPDGILVVDRDGGVRLTNSALLALLGAKERVEIVDTKLWHFMLPEQVEAFQRQIEDVLASTTPVERVEVNFVRADGSLVPVEVTIGSLPWNDHNVVQLIVHNITRRKRAEEEIHRSHAALEFAYDETLEGWARALELRDFETVGHCKRVTELTLRLARALGVEGDALVQIRRGALLHDIGKMGVPDGILLKPGPLDKEEWAVMRKHPIYAYEMLAPIAFLRDALDIPYYHHEKWDGTGYPLGLQATEIPFAARIFAVVDVWDALCSDRPYHCAWSQEAAREHIEAEAGKHFDPTVVAAFLRLLDDDWRAEPMHTENVLAAPQNHGYETAAELFTQRPRATGCAR